MASKHLDSRANLQAGKRDWQTGRQAGRQEREHNYRASESPLVACPPPKSLPPPWIHRLVHPSSTLLLRTTPTLSPVLSAASFVRTVVRRPLRSPLLGALVIQSCSESVYQYIFGPLVSVLFFFFFPSTNRVCRFGSRCRFLCKRISRAFFGSKAWQLAILCQQRTDLPFVPASRHILSSRLSSSSPRLSSSLLELSSFPRASEGRFGGEVERGLVYTTRETRYPPWWRVYRIDSTVLVNFRRKEKILKGSRFIILCFRKEDAQMEFLVKESEEEYLRDDK